jgi:replication factor A1
VKIRKELCGEEQKVKIIVVKADKVNYSAESRYMLDLISLRGKRRRECSYLSCK